MKKLLLLGIMLTSCSITMHEHLHESASPTIVETIPENGITITPVKPSVSTVHSTAPGGTACVTIGPNDTYTVDGSGADMSSATKSNVGSSLIWQDSSSFRAPTAFYKAIY